MNLLLDIVIWTFLIILMILLVPVLLPFALIGALRA